jgi:2-polyprenyl-3-methyl-5-hydroxy-6-metoxy-1,4-benzoquinol methylase
VTPEQFELFARIEQEHWWFVARRAVMRALVERVALAEGRVVVDVGCGTGGNIASLADRYRCVGLDDSEQAIDFARQRFPDVEFVAVRGGETLVEYVRRADVVMCMDVIEHVEHDGVFLEQIVRAARPGAQLLLTVPADMALWSQHDVTNGHFRRYSVEQFAALWATLPVRARLLRAFNTRLYPLVRAVRALGALRGRAHGEAGTDFAMPAPPVNEMLRRIFAGERGALLAALDAPPLGDQRGVSLIALLERLPD